MIIVSRLNGERFGVNADHIERIEEMPDTVLTLADGTKYIVCESLDEVIGRIVEYRSNVLRISYAPADAQTPSATALHLVDGDPTPAENASLDDRQSGDR